jgi:hypothetical protein
MTDRKERPMDIASLASAAARRIRSLFSIPFAPGASQRRAEDAPRALGLAWALLACALAFVLGAESLRFFDPRASVLLRAAAGLVAALVLAPPALSLPEALAFGGRTGAQSRLACWRSGAKAWTLSLLASALSAVLLALATLFFSLETLLVRPVPPSWPLGRALRRASGPVSLLFGKSVDRCAGFCLTPRVAFFFRQGAAGEWLAWSRALRGASATAPFFSAIGLERAQSVRQFLDWAHGGSHAPAWAPVGWRPSAEEPFFIVALARLRLSSATLAMVAAREIPQLAEELARGAERDALLAEALAAKAGSQPKGQDAPAEPVAARAPARRL